jgi:hypothetical protein
MNERMKGDKRSPLTSGTLVNRSRLLRDVTGHYGQWTAHLQILLALLRQQMISCRSHVAEEADYTVPDSVAKGRSSKKQRHILYINKYGSSPA